MKTRVVKGLTKEYRLKRELKEVQVKEEERRKLERFGQDNPMAPAYSTGRSLKTTVFRKTDRDLLVAGVHTSAEETLAGEYSHPVQSRIPSGVSRQFHKPVPPQHTPTQSQIFQMTAADPPAGDGGTMYNYFRIIYPFSSPEFIMNKRLEKISQQVSSAIPNEWEERDQKLREKELNEPLKTLENSSPPLFYPWGKKLPPSHTVSTIVQKRKSNQPSLNRVISIPKNNSESRLTRNHNPKFPGKNAVWGNVLEVGDINAKRLNHTKLCRGPTSQHRLNIISQGKDYTDRVDCFSQPLRTWSSVKFVNKPAPTLRPNEADILLTRPLAPSRSQEVTRVTSPTPN